MTRRFSTSLLTLAYIVGQLAAPPHTHGSSRENEPSDHDARPHFHLSLMTHGCHGHDDDHEHHHDHAGHAHHHHSCDGQHANAPVAETERNDHDSDAIYLPNGAELSLPAKNATVPVCLAIVSDLAITTAATLPANFHASTEAKFPDKCSPHCALYLALRALRI